jgi:hypothetical protein
MPFKSLLRTPVLCLLILLALPFFGFRTPASLPPAPDHTLPQPRTGDYPGWTRGTDMDLVVRPRPTSP